MPRRVRDAQSYRREAVIFDFDGTIADSFTYVFKFLKKEAGDNTDYTDAELAEFRHVPMKDLALRLGVPVWRLPLTYFRGRRVMRAHMEHVQPFDGMIDAILKLHEDGCQLFIASANNDHNIRHLLRKEGVLSCFRAIRSSAGITGKSALIRQLMVRYSLIKQVTWYVGDETGDIASAKKAGVKTLAVNWGFANPEKLRESQPDGYATAPTDVVKIIEESWKK